MDNELLELLTTAYKLLGIAVEGSPAVNAFVIHYMGAFESFDDFLKIELITNRECLNISKEE